jgi:transcription-repair coupling factor (superfamily II helicase)
MFPRLETLEPDAKKRLNAIQEYSQLGAGFKIAMEDLEIRGAGNLLGVQQHGFIAAVGFDLYCRLLREAIGKMKEEIISGKRLKG